MLRLAPIPRWIWRLQERRRRLRCAKKIEQALAEDKPVNIPEVFLKDKALAITVSQVKDLNGDKIGASVLFHDITTEKSLEK